MYSILICDDERDIRNALRIYLENEGYTVLEAEDGEDALRVLEVLCGRVKKQREKYFCF